MAKDMTFAQRVISHIKNLIADIKNIYNKLISEGYEDIAAWQNDLDALEKLNDMMLDALNNIEQKNTSASKAEKNTSDEVRNSAKRVEITRSDVEAAQSISQKSINSLTSAELNKLSAFAEKYWNELGTKSPFFRAWFGDWRANDKSLISVATQKDVSRGLVANDDTGWEINVSAKVFDETKTQRSSATVKARPYLPYIRDIIKNAVLLDSLGIEPKKSENSLLMHSFYCVADIGNGKEVLKLYVEEMYDPTSRDTNKRAYKLKSIEKASTVSGKVQGQSLSSVTNTVNAIKNISDLFAFVKKHDSEFKPKPASKIVNADGTPKVMYHGTQSSFTAFDKKKAKSYGYYGKGFYFTDSESHAQQYGNSMAVYLDVKNPLEQGKNSISKKQLRKFLEAVAENEDYDIWNYGTENISEIVDSIYKDDAFAVIQDVNATAIGDFAEAIALFNKVNGTSYDGIVTPTETVVYEPTQIKSVENIGTFDKNNPDIRFSTKRDAEQRQKQLDIINETNPAPNTYSTWIRTVDDIKTLSETLEDDDWEYEVINPDLTRTDIQNAIESGEITVYSSYPIENGVFVSPSRMEAESYSGDGRVYEKTVDINDVAWIDPTQGQYAKVDDVRFAKKRHWKPNMPKSDLDTIKRMAKNELFKTNNYLDNITKWLYNVKNRNTYFALYSTEDESDPTILYASKDGQAVAEYSLVMSYLNELGDESDDGKAKTFNEILEMLENSDDLRTVYSGLSSNGRNGNGDVSVYSRASSGGISRALLNCLQDCYERRRSVEGKPKYSTKRQSSVSEDASDYITDTKEFKEIIDIVDQRYRLTNRKKLSPQAIDRFAGRLLSKSHSQYSREQLTERLTALFDYMANSGDCCHKKWTCSYNLTTKKLEVKNEQVKIKLWSL